MRSVCRPNTHFQPHTKLPQHTVLDMGMHQPITPLQCDPNVLAIISNNNYSKQGNQSTQDIFNCPWLLSNPEHPPPSETFPAVHDRSCACGEFKNKFTIFSADIHTSKFSLVQFSSFPSPSPGVFRLDMPLPYILRNVTLKQSYGEAGGCTNHKSFWMTRSCSRQVQCQGGQASMGLMSINYRSVIPVQVVT